MELLKRTGINLLGKEVVIIGYSKIIGKPLALMLDETATITTCHIGTDKKSLIGHINRADVLITAVGKADFKIESSETMFGVLHVIGLEAVFGVFYV